jgi:hypothetical protein
MVVNDDGNHLCRGEIGVAEALDESSMVFSAKGLGQEALLPTWWKKDHRVAQVNDGHSTSVIEAPSMADCRWD